MRYRTVKYRTVAKINGLIAFSLLGPAGAMALPGSPELAPPDKVDACIAKIAEYADYSNASRVRHQVESEKRRAIGYKLFIDTTVYGDDGGRIVREYVSTCVVAHGETPVSFDIEEMNTGA